MASERDPFEPYLKRAADLYEAGDLMQAGQIWQAILKKKPDHEAAKAGLYKLKAHFDARATQTVAKITSAPAAQGPDPEIPRLLEQGCTLYDAGHVEDAIQKWLQVLAKEPENVLAKGYISGARRVFAEVPPAAPQPAAPQSVPVQAALEPAPQPVVPDPGEDIERLLRDGCTLFDMGQVEDALRKWEQILARDPGHVLARAYVQDARKDLGLAPLEEGERPALVSSAPAPAAPHPAGEPGDEQLEALVLGGVQLYDMGMTQEAMEKWQKVLELQPGHRDAEAYLAMARRDSQSASPSKAASPAPATPAQAPAAAPAPTAAPVAAAARVPKPQLAQAPIPVPTKIVLEMDVPEPAPVAQPVTPPTALTAQAQPPRKGFNLPEALNRLSVPSWVASPAFILGTIVGLVVLVVGSFYFVQHRKDEALRHQVESFRASATAPLAQDTQIRDLHENADQVRQAARSALGADPLMAYYLAQELVALTPGEASALQLLENAKAGLPKGEAPKATAEDFEKQFRAGQLESAEQSITALLLANPDDPGLRARASRLYAVLARDYAARENWSEAQSILQRGQALNPADRSWTARQALVDQLRGVPKGDRAPWISLLG